MSSEAAFVPPVRTMRAYEELAASIRRRIEAGELGEGDRLPSESALAQDARVSRSTVREALRTLQEAGLIARSSPRVMVVAPRRADPAHGELTRALRHSDVTFRDLHEALLVLEPALTRMATERRDPATLQALAENLRAQEQHLDDLDVWNRLDQEFHTTIAESSASAALIIARAPISDLLLPVLNGFMVSGKLSRRALVFHERIVEEMVGGDAEAAALMQRKHVEDFRIGWERAGLTLDLLVGHVDEQVAVGAGHAAAAAL